MALPSVKYTKARGTIYHFNIPIPPEIRHHYPAKVKGKFKLIYDGTMKTSDPRRAEERIRERLVIFDRQKAEATRKVEQDRIKESLAPEDAKLLAELGGLDGLLKVIKDLRADAAFTIGGQGAQYPAQDEDYVDGWHDNVTPPTRITGAGMALAPDTYRDRIERASERKEIQARIDNLTAETRRMKAIAGELGEDVPPAPIGLDEGHTGIRELAEAFMDAHSYTVQNRESVRNTIRRWIELHGNMPITKWTRTLLNEFDNTLRGLPASGLADVRGLPIREAVALGKRDAMNTP